MNAMVPGLAGGKMSSSDPDSKIDFLDPPDAVRRKIKKAFCEEGNVADNGVLAFVEAVLIPISELRLEHAAARGGAEVGGGSGEEEEQKQKSFASEDAPAGTVFSVSRDEKYGGPMHFSTYDALREAFERRDVHPKDLKGAVAEALVSLLAPIRRRFEESKEWQDVFALAYPSLVPEKKKKKVRLVPHRQSESMSSENLFRRRYTTLLRRVRERMPTFQRRMQGQMLMLCQVKLTVHYLSARWGQGQRARPKSAREIIDKQNIRIVADVKQEIILLEAITVVPYWVW